MVHTMVERATSNMLIGPDWAMNIEICDMLNQNPAQARDVVKGIKKRIWSKNSKAQLLALTLLETIVKNCGDIVHMHVAEKDIPHEMVKIVRKKPDFHVKEKILTLIDTWQEAFGGPRARYGQYFAAYQELLRAGAVFPKRSESSAPVFTPPQTHPLSSYPTNLRNSGNQQETPEASAEDEYPTLSLSEIQNARGIVDVLVEMLSAINPANKEALRQEVIVDLVEQCRTYKHRVMHLVNSTTDEAMLSQGLALNDDLQKILAKHEAIVSGTPVAPEKHVATSSQALVDVDAPLVDTGDGSKQTEERSTTGATLPTLPVNGFAPTSTKADPNVDLLSGDLLSGDDFNMPNSQDSLALVPVTVAEQSGSVASQENALALVDMFQSTGNAPRVSNPSPMFPSELSMVGPEYQQHHNLHPLQSNPYATNGMATSLGQSQYEQTGNPQTPAAAWNSQVAQTQTLSPNYGVEDGGSFPAPPWESQASETNQPFGPPDTSSMQIPSMGTQQPPTFQDGYHPFPPQSNINGQVPEMYSQHLPSMNPQVMQTNQMHPGMYPHPQAYPGGQMMGMVPQEMPGTQMGSMYPSQMYGNNQMAGYGYGYAQQQQPQPDAQYLNQQMYGLSMKDNGYASNTSNQTSMASYLPPMRQQPKGDDKLFGDLVNMAKTKTVKPGPSGNGSV